MEDLSAELETSQPVVSPDQLTITHRQSELTADVENIRQKGDALDRLKWLKHSPSYGALAIAGAGATGLFEGTFYLQPSIPGAITLVAATAVAAEASKIVKRRRQQRGAERALSVNDSLSAIGDDLPVEVYRARGHNNPSKSLHLRWHNTASDELLTAEPLTASLRTLLSLAESTNMDRVVIPKRQIADYLDGDEPLGISQTQDEWFKKLKKRSIVDERHGKEVVTSLSRPELEVLLKRVEQKEQNEPLDTIIRILRELEPNHPVLRWYQGWSKNRSVSERKMAAVLRSRLERPLNDIGRRRFTEDNEPYFEKFHAYGVVKNGTGHKEPTIEWRNAERHLRESTSNLLGHYRLGWADLETILNNPGNYPKRLLTQICELTGWLTIQGYDLEVNGRHVKHGSPTQPAVDVSKQELPLERRVTESVLGHRDSRRFKRAKHDLDLRSVYYSRTMRSLGMVALSAGLSLVAGKALTVRYDSVTNNVEAAALKAGGDPYGTDADKKIFSHPEVKLYDQISIIGQNYLDHVNSTIERALAVTGYRPTAAELNRLKSGSTDTQTSPDSDAGVGNVPNGPNKPVYFITPHGGMDSTGYWADGRYEAGYNNFMGWLKETTDYASDYKRHPVELEQASAVLPPAEHVDPTKPGLVVSRYFELGYSTEFSTLAANGTDVQLPFHHFGDHSILLEVPILSGTHVEAASSGTGPVRLLREQNGMVALLVPRTPGDRDEYVNLSYVLAPGSTEKVTALSSDNQNIPSDEEQQLSQIWQEVTGLVLPPSGLGRVVTEQQYIANNFAYRLAPLANPDVVKNRETYARAVLARKLANCNVANSLLTISNPGTLSYVTGFFNENTSDQVKNGQEYLSTAEAHAWTVDAAGTIHDATPINGLTAADAKHFAENFGNQKLPAPNKTQRQRNNRFFSEVEATFGAVMLAAAVSKRRSLQHLTKTSYANARLLSVSNNRLRKSYAALNHAIWAPPGSSMPKLNQQPKLSRKQTLEKFRQYSDTETSEAISSQLTQFAKISPSRSARRAARRANRVLKHLRLVPVQR